MFTLATGVADLTVEPLLAFLDAGGSSVDFPFRSGVISISSSANLFGLILRPLLLTISVPVAGASDGVEGVVDTVEGGGVDTVRVSESLLLSVGGLLVSSLLPTTRGYKIMII